jgi:hypothetical protein
MSYCDGYELGPTGYTPAMTHGLAIILVIEVGALAVAALFGSFGPRS